MSVDALDGVGDVRVDLKTVEVADDQKGWVFEVFAVAEELLIGGGQVPVLAFVFPAKMPAHPDVGPAARAVGLGDAALERVVRPLRVGGGWLGLVEDVAEVEKVLMAGAAFGEIDGTPFGDELLRRHGSQL